MAANGDTEALNILGLCYEDGCNVERDKQRAYQYYRMSAERGDSHGMFKTARIMGEIEIPGIRRPNARVRRRSGPKKPRKMDIIGPSSI